MFSCENKIAFFDDRSYQVRQLLELMLEQSLPFDPRFRVSVFTSRGLRHKPAGSQNGLIVPCPEAFLIKFTSL